jgi:uncharacterized protein with GYD domain
MFPGGEGVRFVSLVKFKKKVTKELIAENLRLIERDEKEGPKLVDAYWTLGRYDAVAMIEASDEKAAMRIAIRRGETQDVETLVAIPVTEAGKLVE